MTRPCQYADSRRHFPELVCFGNSREGQFLRLGIFQLAMCPSMCRLCSCNCSMLSVGQGGDAGSSVFCSNSRGAKDAEPVYTAGPSHVVSKGSMLSVSSVLPFSGSPMCLHGGDSMSSNTISRLQGRQRVGDSRKWSRPSLAWKRGS